MRPDKGLIMSENCCTPPEPQQSSCGCEKPTEPEQQSCCSGTAAVVEPNQDTNSWVIGMVDTDFGPVPKVSTKWAHEERRGVFRCRISDLFRMKYRVKPGLYAVGNAKKESPVFVSANYKFSFDVLRRELNGIDGWILVLDTKGINVWCAAGKGTFGMEELICRINNVQLDTIVDHRKIIVPQLGAPKIEAHQIKRETGFTVKYGPVYAKNIKEYLENGYKATKPMRTIQFTFMDRFVLTPMEFNGAIKRYWIYVLVIFGIFGLQSQGIIFKNAITDGFLFYLLGLIAIVTGAIVTPLLLPLIPFKSFAVKGWLIGVLPILWVHFGSSFSQVESIPILIILYLFFPAVSSYLALNFTGCTPFTGPSGVLKEMKIAIPVYIIACILSVLSLLWYKLQVWGIMV